MRRKLNTRLVKVESTIDKDSSYFRSIDQRITSLENSAALQDSASSSSKVNKVAPCKTPSVDANRSSVNAGYNLNAEELIVLREIVPVQRG